MHKCLIFISGPPGAGKSTLTKSLARELKGVVLDKDCIDEPFSPNERGDHYMKEIQPKSIAALFNLAQINLESGNTVFLDAPWTRIMIYDPKWIERSKDLCKKIRAKLLVVECFLSEEKLKQRLTKRGFARDHFRCSNETAWKDFVKRDQIHKRHPLPHYPINMEETPEICLQKALDFIRKEITT